MYNIPTNQYRFFFSSALTPVSPYLLRPCSRAKPDYRTSCNGCPCSHDHPYAIGFNIHDDLELTDWAGRVVRDGKRGHIPGTSPSSTDLVSNPRVICTTSGDEERRHILWSWVQFTTAFYFSPTIISDDSLRYPSTIYQS